MDTRAPHIYSKKQTKKKHTHTHKKRDGKKLHECPPVLPFRSHSPSSPRSSTAAASGIFCPKQLFYDLSCPSVADPDGMAGSNGGVSCTLLQVTHSFLSHWLTYKRGFLIKKNIFSINNKKKFCLSPLTVNRWSNNYCTLVLLWKHKADHLLNK